MVMANKMESDKIRYRVFDGEKMWYPGNVGNPFTLRPDGRIDAEGRDAGEYYSVDFECIAMLFIGRTDKNEREVWVGDIVEFDPEDDLELAQAEVQQWPGRFLLYCKSPERVYHISDVGNGEVVGNVHESLTPN